MACEVPLGIDGAWTGGHGRGFFARGNTRQRTDCEAGATVTCEQPIVVSKQLWCPEERMCHKTAMTHIEPPQTAAACPPRPDPRSPQPTAFPAPTGPPRFDRWSRPFPRAAPGPSATITTTLLQPKVLPVTPNSRSARARPDPRTPALASPSFTPHSTTHPLRASSSSGSRRLPPACQRTARRRCPPTTTTPSSFPWPA